MNAMAEAATQKTPLPVRGRVTQGAPLGEVGWFRAGGKADYLFKPEDRDDLAALLRALPPEVPVQAFGVLSNTIVRDGGVRGVVVRFSAEFAGIEVNEKESTVTAGAGALDGNVAAMAARAGIAGLEYLSGVPGTVGGALRMNAGAYGTETKDILVSADVMDRQGNILTLTPAEMEMAYRHNGLSADHIFLSATFRGQPGRAEDIRDRITGIKAKRQATQPIREKTGGSTFANPTTADLAAAGLDIETKTWQLIDRAKGRGLRVGGAMMSELHCNFMINTGDATAADLENLGEEVRRRVLEDCGVTLRWEIKRVGEKSA
jgi:UDP-N-acetylmuramate dehydrogenase